MKLAQVAPGEVRLDIREKSLQWKDCEALE